jgi:hypothetical protein
MTSKVENYFNYFTEIEEHFQRRRGNALLLSTLDWALIETWKDAGIALPAVLRGIDDAFDKFDQRLTKTRKVNSIAYCSQAVLAAAEEMKEAAVGVASDKPNGVAGFQNADIAAYLSDRAAQLEAAVLPEKINLSANEVAKETAGRLRDLAAEREQSKAAARLEDLERILTVMEERLLAILLAVCAENELVSIRAQADRELAPYRNKMSSPQIEQLHKQFTHKRLFELHKLPRLSLFYM